LVLDDLPFYTTERKGCRSMLDELREAVHIMSKRQPQRDILATHKTERKKLKGLFSRHNGALGYTVDVRSDDSMRNYLAITVYWCTQDFKLHSTLLNLQPLDGQTAEHAACAFERSLCTFNLWPRVSHITTDGGSDMLRIIQSLAARIPGFDANQQGLQCLCHDLNTAVKDMFGRLQFEALRMKRPQPML
jgi:hypothetical protein